MGYDEDSIRKVKSKGVFDDSFDPMALGLSDDEKKRIARGLESAQRDLAPKEEPARSSGFDSRRGRKAAQVKLGFFAKLVRFFVMLFTGLSPADYEKKKKLKALKQTLRRLKPPVYNFQNDSLSGELANQIHRFVKLVWPYRIVFEEVFGELDSERHLDFQLHYIRSQVTSLRDDELSQLEEESLRNLAGSEKDIIVRKRVAELADLFLQNFDSTSQRALDQGFADFINFKEVLGFNYFSFLRRFNSSYSIEEPNQVFHDIRPEGTGAALKDLESVLLSVNTKTLPAVLGVISSYFEEFIFSSLEPALGEMTRSHFKSMTGDGYRQIQSALSRLVSNQQLCYLIRFVTKNLEYETHVYQRGTNFFDEFSRSLIKIVDARIGRILVKRKQDEMNASLNNLFGEYEPPPEFVYSEATNEIIQRFDLPIFIYPIPFGVSVKYFNEKYNQYIKRVLNRLIVDGSFKDSLARRMLSDEFYRMDDLYGRLVAFSNTVNARKDKGNLLQSMLQKFKGDLPSKKALGSRISAINQELHAILVDIRECVINLQAVLARIDQDIDSEKSEIIDNIRKIGAAANTRFLGELRRSIRETTLFADILNRVFKKD